MGRKPSNGGPSFRFNNSEVAEMESLLQENDIQVPGRDVLAALAEKFSNMPERVGKMEVQIKQVWNWFQNRRYALRAKAGNMRSVLHSYRPSSALSAQGEVNNVPENPLMEFEARSTRDGAWYDVACFLSHRSLETGDPEVLVRFSGFGPEEDEWVNVRKHIRQRSLPCESSECVAVLPGDLILCFQEGKEQALYFDAHVLDSQRRRHDARGCRCRFLVRYDHDQSEEIVPLRKVCRRPENDYRLQQLHAESAKVYQQRAGADINSSKLGKGNAPAAPTKESIQVDAGAGSTIKAPPVGTVVTEMLSVVGGNGAAATPTQNSLPVLNYPKVSPEITQSQQSAKTNPETQFFSAVGGQVPAIPTQAEPSKPVGSLELIKSQHMAEMHANSVSTQIIPGTEGHVVVGSATPAQISLPELGEPNELLEKTQPQYPVDQIMPTTEGHEVCAANTLGSHPEASRPKESFETLMVPTTEAPGAAVVATVSTLISLPKPTESEVSLETAQPQLSAEEQMLPETEDHGPAVVTATPPTQASLPKTGESESSLATSPLQGTVATQVLPATKLHETDVEDRALAQISLPEPNESEVLLERLQQPHSEQTPDDSVQTPILSPTADATPTQASVPELTDTAPGENLL